MSCSSNEASRTATARPRRGPLWIGAVIVFASLPSAAATPTSAVRQAPPPLNVGSDGSDGTFVFVPDTPGGSTMTIDLALAASGLDGQGQPITWQTPSPIPGRGVYDPEIWAVVFKYLEMTIPAGKTLRFSNHPSRAPVVWLVQTSVTIHGVLLLDAYGSPGGWPEPGPGGFRGAQSRVGAGNSYTSGFGPGGGAGSGSNPECQYGNYASLQQTFLPAPYGSSGLQPLIGGSGSSCVNSGTPGEYRGGAGGGALLIAVNDRFLLGSNGVIQSYGSSFESDYNFNAPGAGGAIRIVADHYERLAGSTIDARYGSSNSIGMGRIRIEANQFTGSTSTDPPASVGTPNQVLSDTSTPSIRVVSVTVNALTVPIQGDPRGSFAPPSCDAILENSGSATLVIEARNVTPGRTCILRVANVYGGVTAYTSSPFTGTSAFSTATAVITLSQGIFAMQARVVL